MTIVKDPEVLAAILAIDKRKAAMANRKATTVRTKIVRSNPRQAHKLLKGLTPEERTLIIGLFMNKRGESK